MPTCNYASVADINRVSVPINAREMSTTPHLCRSSVKLTVLRSCAAVQATGRVPAGSTADKESQFPEAARGVILIGGLPTTCLTLRCSAHVAFALDRRDFIRHASGEFKSCTVF